MSSTSSLRSFCSVAFEPLPEMSLGLRDDFSSRKSVERLGDDDGNDSAKQKLNKIGDGNGILTDQHGSTQPTLPAVVSV